MVSDNEEVSVSISIGGDEDDIESSGFAIRRPPKVWLRLISPSMLPMTDLQ